MGRGLIRGEGRRSWLPSLCRTRGPEPPAGPGPKPDGTVLTPDGPAEALAGGGRCRAGVRGGVHTGAWHYAAHARAHGHKAPRPVTRGGGGAQVTGSLIRHQLQPQNISLRGGSHGLLFVLHGIQGE